MKKNQKQKYVLPSTQKPWWKYYDNKNHTQPSKTVYRCLLENNQHHLDDIAIHYFGQKITYRKLFEQIDKVALSLLESGVQKGDVVEIAIPSTPEAVYLFYALSKIGAVSSMIDPRLSQEELENILKRTGSKFVFAIQSALKKLQESKEKGLLQEIIMVSETDSMPFNQKLRHKAKTIFENNQDRRNYTKWTDFIERFKKSQKPIKENFSNQPALMIHTEGKNGKLKEILFDSDAINNVALNYIQAGFSFQAQDIWLNKMPLFTIYGIGNGLHLPLICGMEVILHSEFSSQYMDDLEKINHIFAGSAFYENLLACEEKLDLTNLKTPMVMGNINPMLEKKINCFLSQHGCDHKIIKNYGKSETNIIATSIERANAIGSIGIPLPQRVVGIFHPETKEEQTYGHSGEICIKVDPLFGYHDNLKEEKKMIKTHANGSSWYHSGEQGYMLSDGKIFIEGKIKKPLVRFNGIKTYDEKPKVFSRYDGSSIYSKRIEAVILKHPDIASCVVIGMNDFDHMQGKLPKVYVTLKDNVTSFNIEGELELICKASLPEYSQPIEFEVRDSFPLNKMGKIDYLLLEKEANETRKEKILRK